MARVSVDFSAVEEFEPVPKGDYEAEITGAEFREPASEDKYPYINVEYTIQEEGDWENSKVWGIWSLSPKALWRMKQAWENLGILTDPDEELNIDYDEEADNMITEPELVGIPVMVTVVEEVYEGKTRSRAEAVTALDYDDQAQAEVEAEPEPEPEPEEKKPARRASPRQAAKPKDKPKPKPARRRFQ